MSTSRLSGEGLSRELQADADRYLQRRRAAEEKELLERIEQEEYESWLEQRLHKVLQHIESTLVVVLQRVIVVM
jgi:hypothetical protein